MSRTITSICIFLLLSLSTQLTAQIEKGTISLEPDFFFNVSNDRDSDLSSSVFGIFIRPGFYVLRNFSINPSIGLFYSSIDTGDGRFDGSNSTFSFGGRLTYMIPIADNFYIPTFAGYDYNSRSDSNSGFDPTNSSDIFFGAGIEYLVSDRLGLRFSLSNNFRSFSGFDQTDYSLSGFFGFSLYFEKESE